jgi:hypothetical protein
VGVAQEARRCAGGVAASVEAAFLAPSDGTFTEDWVHGHALEIDR